MTDPTPGANLRTQPLPICRAEIGMLLVILVAGFALRFAHTSRLSVEHFDEGVYASNIAAGPDNQYRYPDRHLYAPPLLPWLIEWSNVLLGFSRVSPMLPGLIFGSLTVGLMWWIARQWFGVVAGIVAAALVATSDFHLLFSRTALTDAPLCFWLSAGVFCSWEAYRNPRLRWMAAAGATTGLAWWTKYNGWLPIAIGLAGIIPWMLLGNPRRRLAIRVLSCWTGVAVTAIAIWSPVWFGLPQPEGYSAVARNHAGYLVGLSGWLESFLQQIGNHHVLDGWLSWTGLGIAVVAAVFVLRMRGKGFTWNADTDKVRNHSRVMEWLVPGCSGVLLCAAAALLGTSVLLGLLAIIGIRLQLLPSFSKRRTATADSGRSLAAWMLAVWFVGLSMTTPLYTAYPRLTLPWLLSAWLGTAAAAEWWLGIGSGSLPESDALTRAARLRWGATCILMICLGGGAIALFDDRPTPASAHPVPGWQDRTELEAIADRIAVVVAPPNGSGRESSKVSPVVYVYAEPAIFFHLSNAGVIANPVGNLEFAHPQAGRLPVPTYLVVGPHAAGSRDFAQQWRDYQSEFERIRGFPFHPSDLVLLNEYDPEKVGRSVMQPPTGVIRLYRLKVSRPLQQ